jgi:hypothetical protein
MQYKLIFVHASPEHRVAGVGMGGNVMIVFSMLSNITDEDSLYVDMETNECVCTEKNRMVDGTKNGWEYYFMQNALNPEKEIVTKTSQTTGAVNFNYEDKTIGKDLSLFIPWKNRFYKNFQPKPIIRFYVESYYEDYFKEKVTLGIQIRLTDQIHHHHTKTVEESISRAKEILKKHPSIDQVFLATDDSLVIPLVEKELSVPVIYHKKMFRADETNRLIGLYDKLVYVREMHRYQTSLECLWDLFTLTKCDYLLKADRSAISIAACLLAENIKKVYWI